MVAGTGLEPATSGLWGAIIKLSLKSTYSTGWFSLLENRLNNRLTVHKDGMNIVLNGEHKGKTINEVLDIWSKSALGKNAEEFSYFPILIKIIDAKQKLSVLVGEAWFQL